MYNCVQKKITVLLVEKVALNYNRLNNVTRLLYKPSKISSVCDQKEFEKEKQLPLLKGKLFLVVCSTLWLYRACLKSIVCVPEKSGSLSVKPPWINVMKTCLISVLILELYCPFCIARVCTIVSNWMLENGQKSRFSSNYYHSFFQFHPWRFCSLLSLPVCIIFLFCLFFQHYIYIWSVKAI